MKLWPTPVPEDDRKQSPTGEVKGEDLAVRFCVLALVETFA